MSNIAGLEALLNQEGLISGLPYDNPDRQKSVYFQHVRDYAASLGTQFSEERQGFAEYARSLFNSRKWLTRTDVHLPTRGLYFSIGMLGLAYLPVTYPLFGSIDGIKLDEESITLVSPSYRGIFELPGSKNSDVHEHNHAYHWLIKLDLSRRRVIKIDGFRDLAFEVIAGVNPEVPDYRGLVDFEKKVLRAMIAEEKRQLSSRNKSL